MNISSDTSQFGLMLDRFCRLVGRAGERQISTEGILLDDLLSDFLDRHVRELQVFLEISCELRAVTGESLDRWHSARPEASVRDLVAWLCEQTSIPELTPIDAFGCRSLRVSVFRAIASLARDVVGRDLRLRPSDEIAARMSLAEVENLWSHIKFRLGIALPRLRRGWGMLGFCGGLTSLAWVGFWPMGDISRFGESLLFASVQCGVSAAFFLWWRADRSRYLPAHIRTFRQLADVVVARSSESEGGIADPNDIAGRGG